MSEAGTRKRSNTRWIIMLSGAVVLMFGFGYALVPLYDLFCEITGIGGKPTVADVQHDQSVIAIDSDREVTIEFTANANNSIPWTIKPLVKKTKVHPGEIHVMNYLVTNTSNETMVGQAVPSITPMQGAKDLVKLECFCFSAQTLGAGEAREMAVRFYVDSDLTNEINTLTLSYSFYPLNQAAQTDGNQSKSDDDAQMDHSSHKQASS